MLFKLNSSVIKTNFINKRVGESLSDKQPFLASCSVTVSSINILICHLENGITSYLISTTPRL